MNIKTINEIFDIIDELGIGMLVTENNSELRSRPMKFHVDEDSGTLWSLTRLSSAKVQEMGLEQDVNLAFSCPETHQYVSVTGRAHLTQDSARIDNMWSNEAEMWFGCKKSDPDVCALKITPTAMEYWTSPSSTVVRVWEFTKAKVTGTTPDMGENEKVRLGR